MAAEQETRPSSSFNVQFSIPVAASLCWVGALALLLLGNLRAESHPLAPQRLLFYGLALAAGLLTFVPAQRALGLPRLALEGVGGSFLLLYVLAFVPPPTESMLALPDLPVYALLITALFWTSAAVVLPFVYAAGQRVFHARARKHDVRRARRQSYAIGAFVACAAALASLRVLTWISLLLVALILLVAELLFLSRVEVGD